VVKIETNLATGSGVIIDTKITGNDAYILTNYHVIEGASQVSVIVIDSLVYNGEITGIDANRDLAVLRICCNASFRALEFVTLQAYGPGTDVIVMGYPLGVDTAVVTKGILSAIYFDSSSSRWIIQTDAPINPGNSGGPLLTLSGQILGINTFLIREISGAIPVEGFGFAVSEQTISQMLPDLISGATGPTPTPTPTTTPAPEPSGAFGPVDGELRHDPDDGFIETFNTGVFAKNLVVEAQFTNPNLTFQETWDHGFMLRQTASGEFHIIFIRNDGILYHYLRTGTGEPDQKLVSQPSSLIDIKPRGTNSLRIVALEDKGWVFINDTYVTTLDLEGISEAGNVQAINGYFKGDGIEGGVTRYEGLTVRRLQTSYGPVDGALAHNDDGFIEEHDSNVEIADAVIEARFFNPYSRAVGQWDYGFIFRGSSVNTFLAVIVTDDGKWQHKVRTGTVESSVLLDSGESSAINTSSNGSN